MTPSPTLSQALHAWAQIFMRRSMSNFMRFARESGVSMQQYGALFHMRRKGFCGVSALGDDLGVTSAAASQMIERLVQQGLLERTEDTHDRRLKHIVLSARGHELVERSMRDRQDWIEALERSLTPEQQESITAALDTLTAAALKLEDPNIMQAMPARQGE